MEKKEVIISVYLNPIKFSDRIRIDFDSTQQAMCFLAQVLHQAIDNKR